MVRLGLCPRFVPSRQLQSISGEGKKRSGPVGCIGRSTPSLDRKYNVDEEREKDKERKE